MPNSARRRGDYFERRTRDALVAQGWWVVRSAGSFGVADLVALKAGHTPMLVSCKLAGHITRAQVLTLARVGERTGAFGVVAWHLKPGWVGLEIRTLHGKARLPDMHMPSRKVTDKAQTDGLSPTGEQLALPFA